jgi:outer membrane protein assembly factor BamB
LRKGILLLACLASACAGRPVEIVPGLLPLKPLWFSKLPGQIRGPLASDGQRVFVAAHEGLRALDRLTPAVKWRRGGLLGTLSASASTLVVRQDDGAVLALDPASGKTRWTAQTRSAGALPALITDGQILVAGSSLVALDAGTGRTLWTQALSAAAVTEPAVGGGCILV